MPSRTYGSSTTARSENDHDVYYSNIAISSTPHPQVRIPTRLHSEELIIEPAIIVRKKGSNKASIVRNPSSATSVTLPSSRRRNQEFILSKLNSGAIDANSHTSSPRSASLGPLQLYEKQLQTIMNIRRAYNSLLRSKVNFNLQIATGGIPALSTVTAGIQSTTEHPRRFDADYDKSVILRNTTPSPPIYTTIQQPKPAPDIQIKPFQPLVWRKEIKNVLKQFSPVPPLKQLVSFVSTSTENYLRDFLNRNRLQQPIPMFQPTESTTTPSPTPPSPSFVPYPIEPFTTIHPFHDQQRHDPGTVPIHEIYQNHDFKVINNPSTPRPGYFDHSSYLHKTLKTSNSQSSHDTNEYSPKNEQFPFMHELMKDIISMDTNSNPSTTPRSDPSLTALPTFSTPGPPYAEIEEVRPLSFLPPPQPEPATPTKRTFTTGQINNHSPSGFRQQYLQMHPAQRTPPTVRVNLDKPIYINPPFQQPQKQAPNQQLHNQHSVQHHHPQQPTHHPHHYNRQPTQHPPLYNQQPIQQAPHYPQQPTPRPPHYPQHPTGHSPHFHQQPAQQRLPYPSTPFYPHHTNRRIYSIPHRPFSYAPSPIQQPFHIPQLFQRGHQLNQQQNTPHRPIFQEFFMPKPKQYRLVLKGPIRDAAVRMDDAVPQFVSKIAHEFFKKPEIYIPKIRPGKPLTLEKVILNHKEIVPTEMSFSPTPGAPSTKLRFSQQAQWEMKEELARQGIMLDEPLNPVRDYAANDPNVMEMDAPVKAVQTWETHSPMGMGTYPDYSSVSGTAFSSVTDVPQFIQQASSQQQKTHLHNSIPLPTPAPSQITFPSSTPDYQHQQMLQQQLIFAQQQPPQIVSSNDNAFKIDPSDFNDFKQDHLADGNVFPPELQIPGIEQVVVDKYIVHDPMDPTGAFKIYSTTTVQPPTTSPKMNLVSILTQHHRNGLAALPAHGPTPPPAVLVRHHGAPSPVPASFPPPTQAPVQVTSYSDENFLVTLINSTPQPFVTTTVKPIESNPALQVSETNSGILSHAGINTTRNIVSQIEDFLINSEMDFGARPQLNLYDMLLQHRTGLVTEEAHTGFNYRPEETEDQDEPQFTNIANDDQMATETKSVEDSNVDTEKVAKIFSIDYQSKYNKKPPAVIVIKVPPNHSDGPFPKVIEKRRGEEIEIQGGYISNSNASSSKARGNDKEKDVEAVTTQSSIFSSTKRSIVSSESSGDSETANDSSYEQSSRAKRRRNRKNKKRKRRRKKKKNRNRDEEENVSSDNADDKNVDKTTVSNDNEMHNLKINDTKFDDDKARTKEGSKNEKEPSLKHPDIKIQKDDETPEEKFQAEIDWKSQLMANICDINPSSPLCLTYRSICLLMTSDD